MQSKLGLFAAICMLILAAISSQAQAAEEITVYLKSGRSFTGFVDAKTNEAELVLRFEEGWATLWRPIAWHRIIDAEYNSKIITPEALKQNYHHLSSEGAVEKWLFSGESLPNQPSPPPVHPPQPTHAYVPDHSADQVRSIVVQASLGNWNRGAEQDGLVVSLFPLNADGQIIPISGTIEFELLGLRRASARSQYVYSRGNPFPSLGRWTRRVYHTDVTSSGVQYRLPFQAYHPEFDLDLAPHGMVQVKLSIPGQGTFSETVELLRIRPFSPFRDIRQQLDGTRFFPNELLSRTE